MDYGGTTRQGIRSTLRAFYRAACGVGHADLPTAVHDVLGVDTAGVLADWQQWLTR